MMVCWTTLMVMGFMYMRMLCDVERVCRVCLGAATAQARDAG